MWQLIKYGILLQDTKKEEKGRDVSGMEREASHTSVALCSNPDLIQPSLNLTLQTEHIIHLAPGLILLLG